MGYLTREQSPQTASLTLVLILILNNLTFKISSFHLLYCQQRALQTLTGDNRSFHSKLSLLRGSSAGALVVLCPCAFSTITSALASQRTAALFKCILCLGYLSRRGAVKCHKKVGGTVICFLPAAELK